jgi:pilus assembly protein CpaE
MRAGCSQVVPRPIDPDDFNLALQRIFMKEPIEQKSAETFAFIGSGSGAGATSLAVNLSMQFAAKGKKEIGLLEANLERSTYIPLFNIHPQFSLSDIMDYEGSLDFSVVNQAIVRKHEGLAVIPGGNSDKKKCECCNNDRLYDTIRILQKMFPLLLMDVQSELCPGKLKILQLADKIVLVCRLNLLSLHAAMKIVRMLELSGAVSDRILIVANRYKPNEVLTVRDAERVLGRKILATVVEDYAAMNESNNTGVPLYECAPKSRIRHDIEQLTYLLFDSSKEERESEFEEGKSQRWRGLRRFFGLSKTPDNTV